MGKGVSRLPASFHKLKPGTYNDGNNLYLQISIGPRGNRRLSWVFRYTMRGRKVREMGLGGCSWVALGEARELARKYKTLVRQGIDPIDDRNAQIAKNLAAGAGTITFDQAAAEYIRQHRSSWSNPVHAKQWPSSIKRYASPIIGKLPVDQIQTSHISKVLDPIWHSKAPTAQRLRGRIEAILGWCEVRGFRRGDNVARWKGHLANALPPPSKIRKVKRITSLPYEAMPAFMGDLRKRDGVASLALQFLILTAVRSHDVVNAKRADVDVDKAVWTIPSFSKVHHEHRVPLSAEALAVVEKMCVRGTGGELLFPSEGVGQRLSKNALNGVVTNMGRKGQLTPHGVRSSFRTFVQERTSFPPDVAEAALGHVVGSAVMRAYARSDLFERRRKLMEAWTGFLAKPTAPADVVPLHGRRRVRP